MTAKCTFCNDTKIEPGVPGPCVWCEVESPAAVERHTIANLRYAGGKEHDVRYVSEVHYDAALAREAALREELDMVRKAVPNSTRELVSLQQRLTVAETREFQLNRALGGMLFAYDDGVGREWSAPLLDYARELTPAIKFKPIEKNGLIAISNPPTATGIPAFAYCSDALKPAEEVDHGKA